MDVLTDGDVYLGSPQPLRAEDEDHFPWNCRLLRKSSRLLIGPIFNPAFSFWLSLPTTGLSDRTTQDP